MNMTTFAARLHRTMNMQLLLLAFFLLGTLLIMPISLFVFDNDEGINVIKAVLMADGYPLYTQTWSDQPPVFTQLLQVAFALFGETMLVARLLVLTLTTLFVWAYTSTIRLQLGTTAAWVALLLLMLSDNFLRLSVSVMIGLPALSFAMVAIYLLQLYKAKPRFWLLGLAGLLMALSIQTKVFTIILVPIIGLDLLDFGQDLWGQRARFTAKIWSALGWGIVTTVVCLLIGIYYHALDPDMLLGAHIGDSVQSAYQNESSWADLRSFLLYDYGHLLLALLGILAIALRRNRQGLLPIGWLLLAFVLLLNHRPIWYHHYQMIAIPLCWLAAYLGPHFSQQKQLPYAVVDNQRSTVAPSPSDRPTMVALSCVAVVVLGLIYLRGERTVPYYNQRSYDKEVVRLLETRADSTRWVFADQAIYPFYAGLRVPPEIAVFSRKRFFGQNLNNQILQEVMERYQPEQVLLTRFKDELLADPEFAGYLDAHYTTVRETPDYGYYRIQVNQ